MNIDAHEKEASDFKNALDSVCTNNSEPSNTAIFLEKHSDKVRANI